MGLIDGFVTYENTLTSVLNSWADMGVFAYVLPFLIIFAVIFGILNKTQLLGGNKGVQATIALAAGLLSLQFDYVANFFATIFPYAGMGIGILLVALILMGLISSEKGWHGWVWFIIGIIVFLVVLLTALSDVAWIGGLNYRWADWRGILLFIVIVGLVVWLIAKGQTGETSKKKKKKVYVDEG